MAEERAHRMNKKLFCTGRLLTLIGILLIIGSICLMRYAEKTYYKQAFLGTCIPVIIIGIAIGIIGVLLMKWESKNMLIIAIISLLTILIIPVQKHNGIGLYEYKAVLYSVSLKYHPSSDEKQAGFLRTIRICGMVINEEEINDEEYYKSCH
ncbi:MAG: hypothetical protein ACI4GW_01005 [Lachnospiraceae bacterium]